MFQLENIKVHHDSLVEPLVQKVDLDKRRLEHVTCNGLFPLKTQLTSGKSKGL